MTYGQNTDISNVEVTSGDAPGTSGVSEVTYDTMYNAVYDATLDALAVDLEVTDGQSVSSSALTYFEGILGNQRIPKDYVIYVGEEYTYASGGYGERTAYEYCMVTGDLECVGTDFSGVGDLYILRLSGNVGVSVVEDQQVAVSVPLYYGRSNLGLYSGIIDRDWSGYLVAVMLALGGATWLVRKLLRISY